MLKQHGVLKSTIWYFFFKNVSRKATIIVRNIGDTSYMRSDWIHLTRSNHLELRRSFRSGFDIWTSYVIYLAAWFWQGVKLICVVQEICRECNTMLFCSINHSCNGYNVIRNTIYHVIITYKPYPPVQKYFAYLNWWELELMSLILVGFD